MVNGIRQKLNVEESLYPYLLMGSGKLSVSSYLLLPVFTKLQPFLKVGL